MLTTATVLSSDARRRLGDTLDRADPTDELFEMVDDGFFRYWIPEIVEMRRE